MCPHVRSALVARTSRLVPDSCPLITGDTIFHPELPDGMNRLLQQEDDSVNFQEFGIGANPREMSLGDEAPDGLIVPNRIFFLDLRDTS